MENADYEIQEGDSVEDFAMGGIHAAIHFAKENNLEPSAMLGVFGSMFWTYLMMISPANAASDNIDSALKYMRSSAEESRSRIQEMEWADRMTHDQEGNA
jgi:hypothetical protein